MADEEIILKVSLDGAQEELNNLTLLQDAVNQLAQEKKELNQTQKELTEAIQEGSISDQEAEQASLDLAEAQVQLSLETKETKLEFREAEKAVIDNAKANNANEGSIAQMRVELAAAQREYVGLSEEQRNNEEIGGALQESISAQSEELKGLEKDIGITSRSVGDYGSALDGAMPLMGGFGKQIQGVVSQLSGIKSAVLGFTGAQKASTAATAGTSKGLKVFRLALISTGIGAIVVVLGTLIAAFLSTQRGVDAVTRVLAPLKELFQTFIGFLQGQAIQALADFRKALDDPKQALIDIGNAIKENFINRFKGSIGIVKANINIIVGAFKLMGLQVKKVLANVPLLGRAIDQVQLKKDLEAAKKQVLDAGRDLAEQSLKTVTGVEDAGAKLSALFGIVGEQAKIATKRAEEMHQLTLQIRTAEIDIGRQRAESNALIEEQRTITQDVSRTDAERLAAAKLATAEVQKITKIETGILDLKIKALKLSQEANDTDAEGQKELQDLIGERIQKEADGTKQSTRLSSAAFTIRKQQQDKASTALKKQQKEEEKARKAVEKGIADDSKKKIDAENKLIDTKIEGLKLARQLELATIDETNEEKIQKEAELLDSIGALRVEKATLNGEDVAKVELENQIAAAEAAKEQQDVIDSQKLEKEKILKDGAFDIAQQSGVALLNAANARAEREKDIELANLNAKLQSGLITQEEFEKKKLAIEQKSFRRKKAQDLAIIAIDLAKELSAISAAAAANPANALTFGAAGISQAAVLSGIAIAKSAIQAGVVGSQKFASGGVIHGASHDQGGVNIRVGSGIIEAEGGEAIINKRSTRKHLGLLSAINMDGGGVSLAQPNTGTLGKFGNGGIATSGAAAQGQTIDLNDLETRIASAVGSITVQNVASETTGVANRVKQIEDSASF